MSGKGVPFIVDASQSAGLLDIDIEKDCIDALCCPGHKSLYGIQGSGFVLFSARCASPDFWEGAAHFDYVFGLAPRIAFASFVAFLAGSFVNAYVMSRMKLASQGRNFSRRAVVSTLLGEGVDSLIFFPCTYLGLLPLNEMLEVMAAEVTLKVLFEMIALPLTSRVVAYVKRVDGVDVYDDNISYNPLKLGDM